MEVLARDGTPEQQERRLEPLLAGEIRSCFAMTEPKVASSDATNIESPIVRDGDEYVINGHKWYTTNDVGLASAYATARLLRLADGPDEVDRQQIGRLELAKYK